MAQFGGNKNPPWAQGAGRPGQPGQAGTGAIDVPGLVGAFGAAAAGGPGGPHVFHQGGPAGLPPGLAGHLGVPGSHGPAVTLAAMASQPVRNLHFLFQPFFFFLCSRQVYLAWLEQHLNWFRASILDLWDPVASKEIHFCNNSNRKSCWHKLHLLSNLRHSKLSNLRRSRVNSKPRKGFLLGRWPSCTTISVLSMKTSFFRPPLSRAKLHESMYLWFFTSFIFSVLVPREIIVKVCLHYCYAVQISLQIDEFIDEKILQIFIFRLCHLFAFSFAILRGQQKNFVFCTEVQFSGPSSRWGRLQCQHAIQVERDTHSGPTKPEL